MSCFIVIYPMQVECFCACLCCVSDNFWNLRNLLWVVGLNTFSGTRYAYFSRAPEWLCHRNRREKQQWCSCNRVCCWQQLWQQQQSLLALAHCPRSEVAAATGWPNLFRCNVLGESTRDCSILMYFVRKSSQFGLWVISFGVVLMYSVRNFWPLSRPASGWASCCRWRTHCRVNVGSLGSWCTVLQLQRFVITAQLTWRIVTLTFNLANFSRCFQIQILNFIPFVCCKQLWSISLHLWTIIIAALIVCFHF